MGSYRVFHVCRLLLNITIVSFILISSISSFTFIAVSSSSQTFWSQDPFTLLKITENPKELWIMLVISIYIYIRS